MSFFGKTKKIWEIMCQVYWTLRWIFGIATKCFLTLSPSHYSPPPVYKFGCVYIIYLPNPSAQVGCDTRSYGVTEYFGRCWLWISDSVLVPSYPVLIRWRLLVWEDCKGRKNIPFEFQFYFVWVFARLLCCEECLPGIFENSRFSQKRCWNIHPRRRLM